MPREFNRKKKDIQHSLNRRARLRRAYFKLTGETRPAKKLEEKDLEIGSGASEAPEEEMKPVGKAPPKLNKKQLASKRRQEEYHKMKEAKERREKAAKNRKINSKRATARTSKGQPKLGAQVSSLLQKLKEQ